MSSIAYIISRLFEAYTVLIFIYVLMSWIPTKSGIIGDIDAALARICEPFLGIFRKILPSIGGMVDVSPILALIVLQLAERLIVGILV
ncbi:MAG: YggT family protein [Eggerthellaceae bacterium]|nr:YggT family protein [Eggerthellaceae bacterium]